MSRLTGWRNPSSILTFCTWILRKDIAHSGSTKSVVLPYSCSNDLPLLEIPSMKLYWIGIMNSLSQRTREKRGVIEENGADVMLHTLKSLSSECWERSLTASDLSLSHRIQCGARSVVNHVDGTKGIFNV